jgi:hypothetical protein
MDYISALLGIVAGIIGMYCGYGARYIVHQKLPWKDPMYITLIVIEIIAFIALWISSISITIPDALVIFILAVDIGYPLGYVIAKPGDNVYIDLVDTDLNSDVEEIYHYYKDGEHLYMPQSLVRCALALLGVKNIIEMDLSLARRTKRRTIDSQIWALTADAYVTSMHKVAYESVSLFKIWTSKIKNNDGTVTRIPRYLINTYREIHTIMFAQSTLEEPLEFLTKTDTYIASTAAAAEARADAIRANIYASTAPFDGAASLLTKMIRLDIDALNAKDEIAERIDLERKRRLTEGEIRDEVS